MWESSKLENTDRSSIFPNLDFLFFAGSVRLADLTGILEPLLRSVDPWVNLVWLLIWEQQETRFGHNCQGIITIKRTSYFIMSEIDQKIKKPYKDAES